MDFIKTPLKQMIDFQRNAFNTTFGTMVTIQIQMEKLLSAFSYQAPWFSEEGKKTVNESLMSYIEARDDFKNAVNQYFDSLEKFLPASEKKRP